MTAYEQWLDNLNAVLSTCGLPAAEELDTNPAFVDVAATLADWFEVDGCEYRTAAKRIESSLLRLRPSAA